MSTRQTIWQSPWHEQTQYHLYIELVDKAVSLEITAGPFVLDVALPAGMLEALRSYFMGRE